MVLTDLTFTSEGNLDRIGDEINFVKYRLMYNIISHFQATMNNPFPFVENTKISGMRFRSFLFLFSFSLVLFRFAPTFVSFYICLTISFLFFLFPFPSSLRFDSCFGINIGHKSTISAFMRERAKISLI
jgi:hypothetical protein